jgi:hypothetical protein
MKFMLVKSGGRKFRCIDCEMPDPLQLPEVENLRARCRRLFFLAAVSWGIVVAL